MEANQFIFPTGISPLKKIMAMYMYRIANNTP